MRPVSAFDLVPQAQSAPAGIALRGILVSTVLFAGLIARAAAAADGMTIGPVDVPIMVHHVPLVVPVVLHLTITPAGDAMNVAANATGSLAGVQANAKEIAGALLAQPQTCSRTGVEPAVDRIDDAHLSGAGDEALLAMSGHVTAWACTKILGQLVKTKVATSDVSITLPLRLRVGPDNSIGLILAGDPHVVLGDPGAAALAGTFSDDIDKLVRRALDHALDTSKARLAIPAFAGIDATIESAAFASQGKQLSVVIAAKAHMTGAGLTQLLALSVDKSRKQ